MLFIEMLLRTAPFSTQTAKRLQGGFFFIRRARRVHASDRFCFILAIDPVNYVSRFVILPILFGFMCTVKMFSTKLNYFLPFCYMGKM